MSIFEYDQEAHMKCVRQEGYEDGIAMGKTQGIAIGKAQGIAEIILESLSDLGTVSDALRERILQETDLQLLKSWYRLAAKAESIEEFSNVFLRNS